MQADRTFSMLSIKNGTVVTIGLLLPERTIVNHTYYDCLKDH